MISTKHKDYLDPQYSVTEVENYNEAALDQHRVWWLYHRNLITGVGRITKRSLNGVGKFYHVPANELVFLPKSAIDEIEERIPMTKVHTHGLNIALRFWMKLNPDKAFNLFTIEEYERIYRSVRRLRILWDQMRARCYNPNHQVYHNYGGSGIKVCKEWESSDNFVIWSLEQGYIYYPEKERGDQLSLDRIDPTKDYSPENCQWIPHRDNCAKTRHKDFSILMKRWKALAKKYPLAKKTFWGRTLIDYEKLYTIYFNSDIDKLVKFLEKKGFCYMSIYKIRKELGHVIPQRKSERGN